MPEQLRADCELGRNSNGSICFAADVLATIAGIALTEIEGIASSVRYSGLITGKRNQNNIKNITRGVKVEVEDHLVSVNITITIEYGYSVPEVCKSIQENVKKTIETMTGMQVKNVDIHVSGISFAKENQAAAEAEYKKYISGTEKEANKLPEKPGVE